MTFNLSNSNAYNGSLKLTPALRGNKIVSVAAETFNYSALDRAKARTKSRVSHHFPQIGRKFNRIGLPLKVARNRESGVTNSALHSVAGFVASENIRGIFL